MPLTGPCATRRSPLNRGWVALFCIAGSWCHLFTCHKLRFDWSNPERASDFLCGVQTWLDKPYWLMRYSQKEPSNFFIYIIIKYVYNSHPFLVNCGWSVIGFTMLLICKWRFFQPQPCEVFEMGAAEGRSWCDGICAVSDQKGKAVYISYQSYSIFYDTIYVV